LTLKEKLEQLIFRYCNGLLIFNRLPVSSICCLKATNI
jgi:hypothetical protein